MKSFAITKKGKKREVNQDYLFCSESSVGSLPNLFIVADGMGGYYGGEIASRFSVETMAESIATSKESSIISILDSSINEANKKMIYELKQSDELKDCGNTLVAATLSKNTLYVANVGDSRLYLLEDGRLRQITEDHSLVEEMIKKGLLKREEARFYPKKNAITRAVGITKLIKVDFFELEIKAGSKFFLCSDGVSNMIDDDVLEEVVASNKEISEICEELIEMVYEKGGSDDATIIMVEV